MNTLKNKIIICDFANERIIAVEIKPLSKEVVVIGGYTRTNDSKESTKNKFWNQLNELIQKYQIEKKFVMGDINVKVGKEERREVTENFV